MTYSSRTSSYLENDVISRPREWLVPLLYEHLLVSLRRASVQIENGDIEGKAVSLEKASAITAELLGSLDMENGGQIAANLSALYVFVAGEILTVGRTLDRTLLGRLTTIVAELHEAWVAAAESIAPRVSSARLAVSVG